MAETQPAATKSAEQQKKKPGRPRKRLVVSPIDIKGIVTEPSNPEHVLELVYCNPGIFKKLLHLFKQFEVGEIDIYCDHKGIKMVAKDHFDKSTIYTFVNGDCMNLYYCKEPVHLCITRSNLESVFGNLNKNHYKISIILRENYRSAIYVIVKDLEYNNDDTYEVSVTFKSTDETVDEDNDEDYPIRFKMSSRHFKSRISSIRKLGKPFTIQKSGTSPLQIILDSAQNVQFTSIYHDSEKIALDSKIGEDDVFSASVYVDNIKPLASASISDDIIVAADKFKKMSFTMYMDKKENGYAAVAKVFVKLVQDPL